LASDVSSTVRSFRSASACVAANGAISLLFSAEEPDAWSQALLGLRLGRKPQAIIATTPRPTKLIRDLVAERRRRQ
jgi:phage terminase large subunit-like protein